MCGRHLAARSMYDELPAPPTTEEPTADSTLEPADGPESAADPELGSIDDRRERDDRREPDERRERDDRRDRDDESPATGPAPRRSRDGVDPPGDTPSAPPDDAPDCEGDDPDEESRAYRLERLRLWRTLATLAVVVARLIRSL